MSFQREVLPVINLLVHVRRFIRTCARNIIYGTVDHKQPICDPAASIADRMSGSIAIDSLRRRRAIYNSRRRRLKSIQSEQEVSKFYT